MDCDQMHDIADELALGMLTGTERAAALRHLEHCEACRGTVATLAVTADLMLLAAPASPPPAGFESRVLRRIDGLRGDQLSRRRQRRRRRWWRPALVAAAAVVVVAVLVVTFLPNGRGEPVAAAVMRTPAGVVVGAAEARGTEPARLAVEVTDWQEASGGSPRPPYRIRVDERDGARRYVTLPPGPDYSWRVELPSTTDDIASVALVDRDGNVMCSGRFDPGV